MKKCSWCGNNSGKTDSRGMCISCGGRLEIQEDIQVPRWWTEYSGHSGSSMALPIFDSESKVSYWEKPIVLELESNNA